MTPSQPSSIAEHPSKTVYEQQAVANDFLIDDRALVSSKSTSDEEYQPDEYDEEVEVEHIPVTRGAAIKRNSK